MNADHEQERAALATLLGAPADATDIDLALGNSKNLLCQTCRDNDARLRAWRNRVFDEHRREHEANPHKSQVTERELISNGELTTRNSHQAGTLRRIRSRLETTMPDEYGVYQDISVGTPKRFDSPDMGVVATAWEHSGRTIAAPEETELVVQLAIDAGHAERLAAWFSDIGVRNLLVLRHTDAVWELHTHLGYAYHHDIVRGGGQDMIPLPAPLAPIPITGVFGA